MNWPVKPLGEVCVVQRGTTITQTQARSGKIPVVAGGMIPTYCHDTPNREGNVITVSASGANAGYVNFWSSAIFASDCSTVMADSSKVEIRFVFHWLRHQSGYITAKLRSGAAQPHVYAKDIAQLGLPLPPLPEQRRIAAILDQADAIRAERREALAQLDSLTQSLFIEMFGDPVVNPKAWALVPFGDVGTLDRGVSKARPRNAPDLLGGPYPLIQTGDVANCDGYIRQYTATYSEAGLRQSKLWPAGTLCITIAANIGKTGILTFAACFPDSVVGFNAAQAPTVEYVRVWLSFLQKALEDAAPESAQKNINLAILRSLIIPVPPLALQQTFATRIEAVEALKTTHRAALAELDALFASLQHRAFAGQL